MAIEKRNYIPNDYEEVTGVSLGTFTAGKYNNFKLDGIFSFDVSNITFYQDGSELPTTAYDLVQDTTYTAKEADGSGETLYKMFRITDSAYEGIETTIDCYNFGSAVDNELLYSLYVNGIVTPRTEVSDDAELTTSTTLYNDLYVFDSLAEDVTFAITDGGGDERNKFTVQNDDDTYNIIVSGDVDYWVAPGQTVVFYEKESSLVWASAGWELVYYDNTNTADVDPETDGNFPTIATGQRYEVTAYSTNNTENTFSADIILNYLTENQASANMASGTSDARNIYYAAETGTGTFNNAFSTYYIMKMRLWHNGN